MDGASETFRGQPVGIALADPRVKTMSGLEIMQAICDGTLPGALIARTLNFWVAEVSPGRVVFEGEPTADSLNPLGGVHGGWALTLIDSATGCSAHTLLEAGVGYATIETKANMTRGIKPNSGVYRCEGRVLVQGRQIITTDAQLTGADGKIYAHGTSTLMVLRP
ncbi:MAG: PaaI family thioesterase [Alphaproteobacteria bacterium]